LIRPDEVEVILKSDLPRLYKTVREAVSIVTPDCRSAAPLYRDSHDRRGDDHDDGGRNKHKQVQQPW